MKAIIKKNKLKCRQYCDNESEITRLNRIHSLFTTQFFKAIGQIYHCNLLRGQNGDFCQKPLGLKDPGPHTSYSTAFCLCFEISNIVFYDPLYSKTVVKRRWVSGTCLKLFCQLNSILLSYGEEFLIPLHQIVLPVMKDPFLHTVQQLCPWSSGPSALLLHSPHTTFFISFLKDTIIG